MLYGAHGIKPGSSAVQHRMARGCWRVQLALIPVGWNGRPLGQCLKLWDWNWVITFFWHPLLDGLVWLITRLGKDMLSLDPLVSLFRFPFPCVSCWHSVEPTDAAGVAIHGRRSTRGRRPQQFETQKNTLVFCQWQIIATQIPQF